MAKLMPRYSPAEMARLKGLLKPVESWTRFERQLWAENQYGFRHYRNPKIICFEHFQPPEAGTLEAFGRADVKPRSAPRSPPTPPRKPAA